VMQRRFTTVALRALRLQTSASMQPPPWSPQLHHFQREHFAPRRWGVEPRVCYSRHHYAFVALAGVANQAIEIPCAIVPIRLSQQPVV
jgi:hypothetical protein